MFEPNHRQRRLIEEADPLSEQAMKSGRFAPSELVRRMQDEQELAWYVPALEVPTPAGADEPDQPQSRGKYLP